MRRFEPCCWALIASLVITACGKRSDAPEQGASASNDVRSVVLITIDTLRADHLASYGYFRSTSPALDRFLERGTRFEYAYSPCSQTAPAHASLLTGKYPRWHTVGIRNAMYALADVDTTLAEICADSGMRTGAVVSNFVLHRRFGLDQGFDEYADEFPDRERNRSMPEQTAEHAVAKARAMLLDMDDEPFFAWFHFQDPHGPYDAPPIAAGSAGAEARMSLDLRPGLKDRVLPVSESQGGFESIPAYQTFGEERRLAEYVRRYDEEIAYLDHHLATLIDTLETSGRLDDTLVVITSDHGEAFGEDGFYFAHGHSLGPDQTRVPLGFVGPGIAAGRVLSTPVATLSIFSTILNALGLDERPAVEQSISLWPTLRGAEPAPDVIGFAGSWTQDAAFWRGLYLRKDRVASDTVTFSGDPVPAELDGPEVAGEHLHRIGPAWPATAADLAAEWQPLRRQLHDFMRVSTDVDRQIEGTRIKPAALDSADRDKLRRLGYIK